MVRYRVRIRFTKQDDLRWIGHRDLVRTWERLFRRAEAPLSMSEGFHPRPRMTFPSALSVGIAGSNEVLDVELREPREAEPLRASLAQHAPPGLGILSVALLAPDAPPPRVARVSYTFPIPPERQADLPARLTAALTGPPLQYQRDPSRPVVDLRADLQRLELSEGLLHLDYRMTPTAVVRPRELLAALGLAELEMQGLHLTRTRVELDA